MERRWGDTLFSPRSDEPTPVWLRVGLAALSLVLVVQATWILLAEYHRPDRLSLPRDQQASAAALAERAPARQAARLAIVRGDLWAESAFTYSNLLWERGTVSPNAGNEARMLLERALQYSPHRGDVWLLLAAMAERYNWRDHRPGALLKMSYYTAPSERDLLLLRVRVSLGGAGTGDPEVQDMIRRDVRLMVKRQALRPALQTIYRSASAQSKELVERVVAEVEPAYLATLRAASR